MHPAVILSRTDRADFVENLAKRLAYAGELVYNATGINLVMRDDERPKGACYAG